MAVEDPQETATLDGLTLRFCSAECRSRFNAAPDRYLPALTPALGHQHAGA
jgi:YHS domain-containing protein